MKAKCFQIPGVVETSGKRTRGFFALKTPVLESDKKVIFITQMDKDFLEQEVVESYEEKNIKKNGISNSANNEKSSNTIKGFDPVEFLIGR